MTRPPTPAERLGMFCIGLVLGDLVGRLALRRARARAPQAVVVPDGIDWDETNGTWRPWYAAEDK